MNTHAFITPSYAGDFDRFQLLVDTMDEMAKGDWCHYVLTADHDYALFKQFEGARRKVIPDSALLPSWLTSLQNPLSKSRKHLWFSIHPLKPVWPMSGWHVQQLRKMLIARHIDEPLLVFADSDSLLVRPCSYETFVHNGLPRLYHKPGAITQKENYLRHISWVAQSAAILGLSPEALPATDYIGNLVSWRRDHACAMLDHIENRSGRDLTSTMGRHRTFSEYQIYGSFVERVLNGKDQTFDTRDLTLTHWGILALDTETIERFINLLEPHQIAIGVQSFTNTSIPMLRTAYRTIADRLR